MSESDGHLQNRALRRICNEIKVTMPPKNVKICFVLGYPRSDIGKGTLVAQLLAMVPNAHVIKFDGLLNTNATGRHTAQGQDDFGVYQQFNPGRPWTLNDNALILGGELYREFINAYGELENLRIRQHLSLYLELTIYRLWHKLERPQTLIVEVGGVLTDDEVEPLLKPVIQRLQRQRTNTEVILLTEMSHNGEYVKTRTVQDGMAMLLTHDINPTIIAVREPESLRGISIVERIENERIIANRLEENIGRSFHKIISIPFFSEDDIDTYKALVENRFLPYMLPPSNYGKRLVIGTTNKAKYEDFRRYLGNSYQLVQAGEVAKGRAIKIAEGSYSLEENAIAKARAWAILSGLPALADDTGFSLEGLGGEPGVMVRRWAGELGEEATHQDFWQHLQKKTQHLTNLNAEVEQCVAIVTPNGKTRVVFNRIGGYIDKEKVSQPYNGTAYPLAAAFVATGRAKTWSEMDDTEKRHFDEHFIDELHSALRELSV